MTYREPGRGSVDAWRTTFLELLEACPRAGSGVTTVRLGGGLVHAVPECSPGEDRSLQVKDMVAMAPCTCLVVAVYDDEGRNLAGMLKLAQALRRSCVELKGVAGRLESGCLTDLDAAVGALLRCPQGPGEGLLESSGRELRLLREQVLGAVRGALASSMRLPALEACATMALDLPAASGLAGHVVPDLTYALAAARKALVESEGDALVVMREGTEQDLLEDASTALSAWWVGAQKERRNGLVTGEVPVAVAAALEASRWACEVAWVGEHGHSELEVARTLVLDGTAVAEALEAALAL